MEEMMDIVRKYDGQPVTEVHIVGGVLPQYDMKFYADFFTSIKNLDFTAIELLLYFSLLMSALFLIFFHILDYYQIFP